MRTKIKYVRKYGRKCEILPNVSFNKTKALQLLKEMETDDTLKIEGKGRGTKYHL